MADSNLWWAYEAESGTFSPLPPGPFLLPALIIAITHHLIRSSLSKRRSIDGLADANLKSNPAWIEKRERYRYLVNTSVSPGHELTLADLKEMRELKQFLHDPYGWRFIKKH